MTFGQEYLTHLRVIQNIGMARIDEVEYNGMKIVPLQFLKPYSPTRRIWARITKAKPLSVAVSAA